MRVMAILARGSLPGVRASFFVAVQTQCGDQRAARDSVGLDLIALIGHMACALPVAFPAAGFGVHVFGHVPFQDGADVTPGTDTCLRSGRTWALPQAVKSI